MKQTELHLSTADRVVLDGFRGKGVHPAREVNRAHLLMALDDGVAESTICEVLGLGRTALWRTRAAYCQGGLEFALHDEARPGQPRKYQTNEEAEVVALVCSAPPRGHKRWTIRLLAAAARQRPGLANVSRETVRLMLKKRLQALAQADVVHRPDHGRVSRQDVWVAGSLCSSVRCVGTRGVRG